VTDNGATFSVVIPAHNEAEDVRAAILASLAQTVLPVEVVVVDDASTDGTAEIVEALAHAHPEIHLVRLITNRGAAVARNTGIRAASGDVVVFVDADAVPPRDFIQRLRPLYQRGADMVSVESRIQNLESTVARFAQAVHERHFGPRHRDRVGFTQAFSCRRAAALEVEFPEVMPGCGGEDGAFFDRLVSHGYRPTKDFTIVVPHVVPDSRSGFARQWRGRGRSVPFYEVKILGRTLRRTFARRLAATLVSSLQTIAIVPNVLLALRLASRSNRGYRDTGRFWVIAHVWIFSQRRGEWRGLFELARGRV